MPSSPLRWEEKGSGTLAHHRGYRVGTGEATHVIGGVKGSAIAQIVQRESSPL